ncbi:MAG TPA: hypothetical protein VKH82_03935, partial [Candidatus Binatia bacterium]|nr:hypothetical protein [Candidatus Binatia bacterium]
LHLSVLRHEAAAEHDPRALREIAGSFWARRDTGLALALGRNVASPDDVLRPLASHPSIGVREAVARNEGLSTDVLVGLAGDAAPQVAASVAANRRTPPEELRLLADPRAPDPEGWQSDDWTRRYAIDPALAANSATPPDVLQLLVQRWAPTEVMTGRITSSLIANPAISDDMLRRIAELNPGGGRAELSSRPGRGAHLEARP